MFKEEKVNSPPMGQTTIKKPEIQIVLEGMKSSNEVLHKTIEQLGIRLSSIIKEELEGKEVEVSPPHFNTELAREFDEIEQGIKLAAKKLRKLMARLEI